MCRCALTKVAASELLQVPQPLEFRRVYDFNTEWFQWDVPCARGSGCGRDLRCSGSRWVPAPRPRVRPTSSSSPCTASLKSLGFRRGRACSIRAEVGCGAWPSSQRSVRRSSLLCSARGPHGTTQEEAARGAARGCSYLLACCSAGDWRRHGCRSSAGRRAGSSGRGTLLPRICDRAGRPGQKGGASQPCRVGRH